MKEVKLIDKMSEADFIKKRRVIRRFKVKNFFTYYKEVLASEQACIVPIAAALVVAAGVLKAPAETSTNLAVMYFACVASLLLCASFTVAIIVTHLSDLYVWQYFQVKRMSRELLAARDFDQMYSVLEEYASVDFKILDLSSVARFDELQLTCAMLRCKKMLMEYGLEGCKVGEHSVRLTVDNYFQQRFVLPMVGATEKYNTLVFTDSGIELAVA